MNIAAQIKKARQRAHLTQQQLAAATKPPLALRTIQNIENGEVEPHFDTLSRIATALKLKVSDMYAIAGK